MLALNMCIVLASYCPVVVVCFECVCVFVVLLLLCFNLLIFITVLV